MKSYCVYVFSSETKRLWIIFVLEIQTKVVRLEVLTGKNMKSAMPFRLLSHFSGYKSILKIPTAGQSETFATIYQMDVGHLSREVIFASGRPNIQSKDPHVSLTSMSDVRSRGYSEVHRSVMWQTMFSPLCWHANHCLLVTGLNKKKSN